LQIPELDEEIVRSSDSLLLGKAEFGRSNQVLMCDKRLLSFDLALKTINSGSMISGARH
jgi:hypothetical protein